MTNNKKTHANVGSIGESSIFTEMIKNLQNPEFVKEADLNIPKGRVLSEDFKAAYTEYQYLAEERIDKEVG